MALAHKQVFLAINIMNCFAYKLNKYLLFHGFSRSYKFFEWFLPLNVEGFLFLYVTLLCNAYWFGGGHMV